MMKKSQRKTKARRGRNKSTVQLLVSIWEPHIHVLVFSKMGELRSFQMSSETESLHHKLLSQMRKNLLVNQLRTRVPVTLSELFTLSRDLLEEISKIRKFKEI